MSMLPTLLQACLRWSNGHFIAVVLHLGWTYIVGLLFVNLYFYIFNQQRFRADGMLIPALQQALPVVRNLICNSTFLFKY